MSPLPEKKDRKIALVVIDVQKKFTGGNVTADSSSAQIDTINEATALFHKYDRPVIFVHYDGPCDCSPYLDDGGDDYLQGTTSDERDIIVHKQHMNSFRDTKLAEIVKGCGCDCVLLTGMVTQYCVMGTYFGAFDHDLCPYLLEGGTISTESHIDKCSYEVCKTFTMEDVRDNLASTAVGDFSGFKGAEYP